MRKIIIAIDGYSACGKSTIARELAHSIGYTHIDSGALYRTITLFCLQNHFFIGNDLDIEKLKKNIKTIRITFISDPQTGRSNAFLNGKNIEKDIRTLEVADKVSLVSTIGWIRREMVKQQHFIGKDKGIVMDGRDIGTVVFPNAELKLFIRAPLEIRTQRRKKELFSLGKDISFDKVLQNLVKRDSIDLNRKESPLKQAEDAIVIDNSFLSIAEQHQLVLKIFNKIINSDI